MEFFLKLKSLVLTQYKIRCAILDAKANFIVLKRNFFYYAKWLIPGRQRIVSLFFKGFRKNFFVHAYASFNFTHRLLLYGSYGKAEIFAGKKKSRASAIEKLLFKVTTNLTLIRDYKFNTLDYYFYKVPDRKLIYFINLSILLKVATVRRIFHRYIFLIKTRPHSTVRPRKRKRL